MTPREAECYEYMKLGLTTTEIAKVMNISWAGAKVHRKRVNNQISIFQRDRLAKLAAKRFQRTGPRKIKSAAQNT